MQASGYYEPQPLPETEEAVGLDVGLTSFVVDSEGNEIENPRCVEQSADKLARLQRRLARAVRGSNNYKFLKDKIAKLQVLAMKWEAAPFRTR